MWEWTCLRCDTNNEVEDPWGDDVTCKNCSARFATGVEENRNDDYFFQLEEELPMGIRPYLCGAISGLRKEEAKEWRAQATKLWPDALDPMRRELGAPWAIDELVVFDKFDIDKCTFVLARWKRVWPISAGTCMEIFYAWTKCRPILIWKDEGWALPPWVEYHKTESFNNLELLHAYANQHYGLPTK